MKKLYIILLIGILTGSCENFRDDNGDLGGMWQLTGWMTRSSSGTIDSLVANNIYGDAGVANPRKIYYSVHNQVIQLQDATQSRLDFYFCSFSHRNDSLILKTVVDKADNLIADYADPNRSYLALKDFGVPGNGIFHIDVLNEDALVLSSPDDILTFRKY